MNHLMGLRRLALAAGLAVALLPCAAFAERTATVNVNAGDTGLIQVPVTNIGETGDDLPGVNIVVTPSDPSAFHAPLEVGPVNILGTQTVPFSFSYTIDSQAKSAFTVTLTPVVSTFK